MSRGYKIREQHGLHFLTFTTVGWIDLFTRKQCKDIVIASLKYCVEKKGLELYAYVIMPSHLHLILRANESSDGLSSIIRDIKKHTSKKLIEWISTSDKESRREWLVNLFRKHGSENSNNSSFQVWKQDNRPMILEHPKFTLQKLDYIHNNPVVAGIVIKPKHYLYSSARNYTNLEETVIDVEIIDFGSLEGYVYT